MVYLRKWRLSGAWAAFWLVALWPGLPLTAQSEAKQAGKQPSRALAGLLERAALPAMPPDSALLYLRVAAQLAEKEKLLEAKAQVFASVGSVHFRSSSYDSADYFYQQSGQLYRQIANHKEHAQQQLHQATARLALGKTESALKLMLNALAIQEKHADSLGIGTTYMRLGGFYFSQGQPEKSLAYYTRARKLIGRHGHEAEQIMTEANLGNLYFQLGRLAEAETCFEKAIAYYHKQGDIRRVAILYTNLASIKIQQNQFDKGVSLQKKALAAHRQLHDKTGQVRTLNNLAIAYLQEKKYDQAQQYFNEALPLAVELKNPMMQRNVVLNLYLVHKAKGQPTRALEYIERYADLQDTLFNATRSQQIAELQETFDAERREKEIAILKKDQELTETRLSRANLERNMTIAGLLVTLLMAAIVVQWLRGRQRSALLLASKNQELNRQRIQEMLREQELQSVHSMLQGQESERKRIARDLHDRLGSLLATVKLHFQLAKTPEQHQTALQLVDEACHEVRQISHNMVSGVLMKFGLVAALTHLARAVSGPGKIKMETYAQGIDHRLPTHIEIEVYRMVQELLSNTLRHAEATTILVQITRQDNELNLMMEDNGCGFEPDKARNSEGLGLTGVKARVQQLKGQLYIDSGRGNGTTIMIDVPLPAHAGQVPLANLGHTEAAIH